VITSGEFARRLTAAAVHDFAAGVGGVDGVFGIAQWFPGAAEDPELGPTEADFLSEYSRLVGSAPDYPAVQAMAGAVLATRCAELAGSVAREALWEAAASLETSTLFGDFKVDPSTGVQTKHVPVLLRWQGESLGLVEKPRLDQ